MTIELLFGIAGAVAGTLALIVALLTARSHRRLHAYTSSVEASLAAMRREFALLASISTRTGRRLKRIETEYCGVSDRVDQVELRGPAPSFDQAIDSARRGTDPGKLAQQFGLSRGEADLVTRLHGRKKRA